MKHHFLPIIGWVLCSLPLGAQEADFAVSPRIDASGYDQPQLVGVKGDVCYFAVKHISAFMSAQKNVGIYSLNTKDMMVTGPLKTIDNPSTVTYGFDRALFVNNKVIVFARSPKKLIGWSYSPQGNSLSPEVHVAENPDGSSFSVSYSLDKSKLVVSHADNSGKDENAKFHFKIVDDKLTMIQEAVVEFPYSAKKYKNLITSFDNSGNLLVVAEISDNKNSYRFFTYKFHTAKLKEQEITTSGKHMYGFHMNKSLDDKQILLIGLYALDEPKENLLLGAGNPAIIKTTGYVFTSYESESCNQVMNVENDFDIKTFANGDSSATPDGLFNNQLIRHVIPNANNTLTLVLESYTWSTFKSDGNSHTSYFYGPILVSNIDLNGKESWGAGIAKSQFFDKNSTYASFGLLQSEQSLKFIFYSMDNIEKGSAYMFGVDGTGKITDAKEVLNGKKSGFAVNGRQNCKVDDYNYIFLGNKDRLVKMTLK